MQQLRHIKSYEGTWDEIVSHASEVPSGAKVRVQIYEPVQADNDEIDALTWGEKFGDLLGSVSFEPADLGVNGARYMKGFGETKKRREVGK